MLSLGSPWRGSSSLPTPLPVESADSAEIPRVASRRLRWHIIAVTALLALYAFMSWTASLSKGVSFDEGLQLAVGYNLWLNDDYRIEGANGDLVKRWATLPYLWTQPAFPGHDDAFWKAGAPYELAHRFLFQLGNVPELLLAQSRAMVVLLGLALGLLVFTWTRELFGVSAGLIALGLFAFSPHMLAFGAIVSTDMSITLALFASTYCIWRLLHRVTWLGIGASLVVFGALVLSKPTALVILPVTVVLVGVKLWAGTPMHALLWRRKHVLARRSAQVRVIALLVFAHAVAGWAGIWAHYGFRYAASPEPENPHVAFLAPHYRDDIATPLRHTLRWLRDTRAVPEGFRRGVQLLAGNDDETVSFMNGSWAVGGRPWFFPYAIWVKTSPMVLLLLAAGAWILWRERRRSRVSVGESLAPPRGRPMLYALTPLLALIACMLGVAVLEDLNIGHRHVLPIYPALYVLAGASGLVLARLRPRAQGAAVAALLAIPVGESLATRPDYLAYFGPQAGGQEEGFRRLVDSSLDWGMGLPELKVWLDQHNADRGTPVFLGYFGTDNPRYHGIEAQQLPGFYDRRSLRPYPLTAGYYAISATLLQSLYTGAVGPWRKAYEDRYWEAFRNVQQIERAAVDPVHRARLAAKPAEFWKREFYTYDVLRFARLCAWLRNRRFPDDQVGHSILVWKLDLQDLRAALLGPPVELTNDPLPARVYGRHVTLLQ